MQMINALVKTQHKMSYAVSDLGSHFLRRLCQGVRSPPPLTWPSWAPGYVCIAPPTLRPLSGPGAQRIEGGRGSD